VQDPVPSQSPIGDTVRFLGQIAAGWASAPPEAFPVRGAGYGSDVEVEDMDSGVRAKYTLMTGPLMDFDQGHVSLASPIGRALLGRRAGDIVTVKTPQRRRRFRIVGVRTLYERLADEPPRPAA
jgi:transcription elongation factor GreA